MLPLRTRLQTLLCFMLAFQLAVAHNGRFGRRQEEGDSPRPTTSGNSDPEPEPTERTGTEDVIISTSRVESDDSDRTSTSRTAVETTIAEQTTTSTASLTISTNGDLDDSTFLNGENRPAFISVLRPVENLY